MGLRNPWDLYSDDQNPAPAYSQMAQAAIGDIPPPEAHHSFYQPTFGEPVDGWPQPAANRSPDSAPDKRDGGPQWQGFYNTVHDSAAVLRDHLGDLIDDGPFPRDSDVSPVHPGRDQLAVSGANRSPAQADVANYEPVGPQDFQKGAFTPPDRSTAARFAQFGYDADSPDNPWGHNYSDRARDYARHFNIADPTNFQSMAEQEAVRYGVDPSTIPKIVMRNPSEMGQGTNHSSAGENEWLNTIGYVPVSANQPPLLDDVSPNGIITLRKGMDADETFDTLMHELSHMNAHKNPDFGSDEKYGFKTIPVSAGQDPTHRGQVEGATLTHRYPFADDFNHEKYLWNPPTQEAIKSGSTFGDNPYGNERSLMPPRSFKVPPLEIGPQEIQQESPQEKPSEWQQLLNRLR